MKEERLQENKMGTMPVGKLLFNMALPMIISMLVQALYNVVDSLFVSRVSQQALTAVSLAFPAQNMMIAVASGTAVGVNALLSRALGEKKPQLANQIAENGVFLALVGYLLFLVFGLFGARMFLAAQTEVKEIIDSGRIGELYFVESEYAHDYSVARGANAIVVGCAGKDDVFGKGAAW